jgi:hypothetical protein
LPLPLRICNAFSGSWHSWTPYQAIGQGFLNITSGAKPRQISSKLWKRYGKTDRTDCRRHEQNGGGSVLTFTTVDVMEIRSRNMFEIAAQCTISGIPQSRPQHARSFVGMEAGSLERTRQTVTLERASIPVQ